MDKPIQMAIGVGLAIAAMAIVGVYVFGVIGGSTVSTDIVPKTLDAISSNQGKSLQISVALNNQGSGSIASVGAVLRVDVKALCEGGTGTTARTGGYAGCKSTDTNFDDDRDTGAIYFPVSYSEQVVESFGTINIRESIETDGSSISNEVGCNEVLPTGTPKKLGTSAAGFSTLEKAIDYVSGPGPISDRSSKTIGKPSQAVATNVVVEAGDVLCARDLGIFAGEEITLTVIAKTTSGDTIERIIPLTVR